MTALLVLSIEFPTIKALLKLRAGLLVFEAKQAPDNRGSNPREPLPWTARFPRRQLHRTPLAHQHPESQMV
jgi:hypothetical protein